MAAQLAVVVRTSLPRCTARRGASACAAPPATGSSSSRKCRAGRPCRSTRAARRPSRRRRDVLGLARRPDFEIARRAAGAARIDAHQHVAVRHPLLRVEQLPVLVLVAGAFEHVRRGLDRCAATGSCSPPAWRGPWRRARSSGSPGICRPRPGGTRRRAAPRRRPSRSGRPNRSSFRRGFRISSLRRGALIAALAGDDGNANIEGWASQRTAEEH